MGSIPTRSRQHGLVQADGRHALERPELINPSQSPGIAQSRTQEQKRALFLINPEAGNGRARRMARRLPEAAVALGWSVDVRETRRTGHEVELAADAATEGWPVLIVVGGDGTVHGSVNGLFKRGASDTVVAHVPIGTGNDFAKMIGLRKSDSPEKNLRLILEGTCRRFDVGRAVVGRTVDEYFVNTIGVGFAAEAAKNLLKYKALGGFASYVVAVYRTFFAYDARQLAVRSSGFYERGRILMVEVTIGKTTGGGFMVTPEADPCDGLLDVCLIREVNALNFVRHVPSVIRGTHVGLPFVEVFTSERVVVEMCEGADIVHLDGEVRFTDSTHVVVDVIPDRLSVLCAG